MLSAAAQAVGCVRRTREIHIGKDGRLKRGQLQRRPGIEDEKLRLKRCGFT
jgi:hypothetical protein